MAGSLFDKAIREIARRNWSDIRSHWMHFIPTTKPGSAPQTSISEVPGFSLIAAELLEKVKEERELNAVAASYGQFEPSLMSSWEELVGLRETVFAESVFLFHKARHVLGAAENNADQGLRTWSLPTAYQAAFFGAKAILGLLGVAVGEYANRAILVDLYPRDPKSKPMFPMKAFHFLGERLEHRPVWLLFQRLLTVSNVDLWPKPVVNKLRSTEESNFARQRNHLQYKSSAWILNDLHDYDLSDGFGLLHDFHSSNEDIDFDRPDITLVLGFFIVRLGHLLLRDIAKVSTRFANEASIIGTSVASGRHPIYGASLVSN